jgi:hypothetical protein
MLKNKAELKIEGKGGKKYIPDEDYNEDSPSEDEIMKSYEQYKRELKEEIQKRRMNADELDDVSGEKPQPMTEEQVITVLKGHKFRFTLQNYQ